MFKKLNVNGNKNWWETKKNEQFFLFAQVTTALKGKEFLFFSEHALETPFSWRDFDNWLKANGIRLDGPSQYDGLMQFSQLTEEAKDEVHFRETRARAIFALQMWSRFRGDNRMIGTIDNGKRQPAPVDSTDSAFRWKKSNVEDLVQSYDPQLEWKSRMDWKYGYADISDPPLTEYFVTNREDCAVYSQRTIFEYDIDRKSLHAKGTVSEETYWPLMRLFFQFPRNAKQYSRFYD